MLLRRRKISLHTTKEAAFAFAHPFLFEPERLRVPSAWTAPDEDDVDFDHDPFERA